MKSINHIPQSKIQRATKLLKIGAQVGTNYIKYIGNRIISDEEKSRSSLNTANAQDIYDGLSELKGSALKMAQMMSMDDGILPKEFVEKFSLAQFSVPPLSGALHELDIINIADSENDIKLIKAVFKKMLTIINKPFQFEEFNFSSPEYFKELLLLGNQLKDDKSLKSLNGKRGSKHFVYVNRTLIGLLGLMNSLNAGNVKVNNYRAYV